MTARPHALARALNQAGALPVRLHADGFVEVLLVTSRRNSRWIIPKGWLEAGLAPHEVAEKQAWEEAGLTGRVDREAFATFSYDERLPSGITIPCKVAVYLFRADHQLVHWPEKGQRECRWLPSREAARLICNIALQRLVQKIGRQPEILRPDPRRRANVSLNLPTRPAPAAQAVRVLPSVRF